MTWGEDFFEVRRLIAAFPFSLSLCFPEEKKREIESGDKSPHSKHALSQIGLLPHFFRTFFRFRLVQCEDRTADYS
jgi:hypothetical protein